MLWQKLTSVSPDVLHADCDEQNTMLWQCVIYSEIIYIKYWLIAAWAIILPVRESIHTMLPSLTKLSKYCQTRLSLPWLNWGNVCNFIAKYSVSRTGSHPLPSPRRYCGSMFSLGDGVRGEALSHVTKRYQLPTPALREPTRQQPWGGRAYWGSRHPVWSSVELQRVFC